MGFRKNLRTGAAWMREYQRDAMRTLPRWTRVLRVGRGAFGMVSADAEIHYGRTPPHVEPVIVSVPRGLHLRVGQDVFVVGPDTSSDSSHTSWILDVTRPPQYGSWATPPELLNDVPRGAAAPAPAGDRARRGSGFVTERSEAAQEAELSSIHNAAMGRAVSRSPKESCCSPA
jgi:hypothetical protein